LVEAFLTYSASLQQETDHFVQKIHNLKLSRSTDISRVLILHQRQDQSVILMLMHTIPAAFDCRFVSLFPSGVQELANEFGWYPSDWKELAVPRRGGVIVEGFNSDEVIL
jgi:hypothetical protein